MVIAKLVWADNRLVDIPAELGSPHDYQLAGSPAEQLTELAIRAHDGSLGTGDNTAQALRRALAGELGVFEHYNRTVLVSFDAKSAKYTIGGLVLFSGLFNRPGLWFRPTVGGFYLTLNTRTVLEWHLWTDRLRWELVPDLQPMLDCTTSLGFALQHLWAAELPLVVSPPQVELPTALAGAHVGAVEFCAPASDDERWVTAYVRCSRAALCAFRGLRISAKSAAQYDAVGARYVEHPAIELLLMGPDSIDLATELHAAELGAKRLYRRIADLVEGALAGSGLPRETAQLQARAAAVGYLGNALATDALVSGTVAQWRELIVRLGTPTGDAEGRRVAIEMLSVLQSAGALRNLKTALAADGLGEVVLPPARSA